MSLRLKHIAIAVPDLAQAAARYRTVMGAKISEPVPQPGHGVTVVFVELDNVRIELLEPLGDNSPIANFLTRNKDGGLHHLCFSAPEIDAVREKLSAADIRILGDASTGAEGGQVLFAHPKDFCGTLIEFAEDETGD